MHELSVMMLPAYPCQVIAAALHRRPHVYLYSVFIVTCPAYFMCKYGRHQSCTVVLSRQLWHLVSPSGSEFEVSWKRLKGNAAGQEGFLRQLDPFQLPGLFKQSLTAPVLQGIALSALNMVMGQNDHFGIQLLENLKSVPRFDMIVMSLPRREKSALKEHYDAAQNAPVIDSVLAKRLESVRRSYRV